MSAPLLTVTNVSKRFGAGAQSVLAVDNVSFELNSGECLAIVGESGSGKSVSALAVMGLLPSPPATVTGRVMFDGRDLLTLDDTAMHDVRGGSIGMVFQEPMTSLNPLLSIGTQLREGMELHLGLTAKAAEHIV